MGFYEDRVLPRLVDRCCGGAPMQRWRLRAVEGLAGTVVEIGFGSGANLPVLPDDVSRLYAVEPSELSLRRSERRPTRPGLTVTHVGLDGQALPLDDDSCDAALSTFTLCTIPEVDRALDEVRRVVRPGGYFHFLEHGRSPDPSVRRWQERLEPMQRRLAGGCHLTRDVEEMVTRQGFVIDRIESRYVTGPKPWSWFTYGRAVNPAIGG